MFLKIWRWIDDRFSLDAVIRWTLEEEMPGGTSYAYVFGEGVANRRAGQDRQCPWS